MFRRTRSQALKESAASATDFATALAKDRKFRKELLSAISHGTIARRRAARRIGIVAAVTRLGADPKLKAQDGSTFLMAAVGSGRVEAVKFAYQYDNDVKAATNSGSTLIHASVTGTAQGGTQEAQERVCEVIRFLAEKGAPLDEKNGQGRTAIDIADVLPIDKAVDLLTVLIVKSGAQPKSPSKR